MATEFSLIRKIIINDIPEYRYDDQVIVDVPAGVMSYVRLGESSGVLKEWGLDLGILKSIGDLIDMYAIPLLLGYSGFNYRSSTKKLAYMNCDTYVPISVLDYLNSIKEEILPYSEVMLRSLFREAIESTKCDIGVVWDAVGCRAGKVLELRTLSNGTLEIHCDRNLAVGSDGKVIFDNMWVCENSYTELEVLGAYMRACRVACALVAL